MLPQFVLPGVRRQLTAAHQGVKNPAGDNADYQRQQNKQQGPVHTDKTEQNQRERKRVPGTGQQESHHLTGAGAAFVEFHTNCQDTVTAQIQEHTGQGSSKQAVDAPVPAQHTHHQLTRYSAQNADKDDTDSDAPPHAVKQFENTAAKDSQNRHVIVL